MPPPRIRRKSDSQVGVEAEEPALFVVPEPANAYKKEPMPAKRIEMICGDCKNTCYIHVEDPESYSTEARQEMFAARGASYDPPLCGFCTRHRARRIPQEAVA
jgi:hypothetical protein